MRNKWIIPLTPGEVAAAAGKKAEHHRSRWQFWQAEIDKADRDLREKGVEMREMPVTGGQRIQPMFDPQRVARVEECRGKINEHEKKALEYEAYVRFLELQGTGLVELDVDDITYFGL